MYRGGFEQLGLSLRGRRLIRGRDDVLFTRPLVIHVPLIVETGSFRRVSTGEEVESVFLKGGAEEGRIRDVVVQVRVLGTGH